MFAVTNVSVFGIQSFFSHALHLAKINQIKSIILQKSSAFFGLMELHTWKKSPFPGVDSITDILKGQFLPFPDSVTIYYSSISNQVKFMVSVSQRGGQNPWLLSITCEEEWKDSRSIEVKRKTPMLPGFRSRLHKCKKAPSGVTARV